MTCGSRVVGCQVEPPAIWRSRSSSGTLLVFDRASRTWQTSDVTVPAGLEAHMPPSVGIGLEGRLYLGHWNVGESGPMHWWSYPVPQGGEGRPEPALTGTSIAFGDDVQARAHSDGTIVLSNAGEDRLLGEQRPQACEPPSDPDTPAHGMYLLDVDTLTMVKTSTSVGPPSLPTPTRRATTSRSDWPAG